MQIPNTHTCNRDCRRHGCSGAGVARDSLANVPTFLFEQSDTDKPYCLLTRDQARQMKAEQRGKFENHGHTFRLFDSMPKRELPRFNPSESADSCESISLTEMKANVGITENDADQPALRGVVHHAQQKIRAIGRREEGTFDDKSPLAFGSAPTSRVQQKA
jgi:hypothetical protein